MEVDNALSDCTNKTINDKKPRTLEIVDELLDKAKLNKDDLAPVVQNIYLAKTISANDEYKLIEIDQEKLDYLLEGNSLIIRGNESENAICCTQNSTYSFKIAEISNPLLVASNLTLPDKFNQTELRILSSVDVLFMTNSYFVMSKERPKLQKLKNLLEMNLYSGKAYELDNEALKYKINDLLEIIQSSEEEIYNYLNYIEAYQINGYWRILDFKFYNQMMDNILKIIDEKCWLLDQIPVKDIYNELESLYDLQILNQAVIYYFSRNSDNFYSLKRDKIVHFYADAILKSCLKMRYEEFKTILKNSLPNNLDFEFDLNLIQDLCYIDEPYIYYLNVQDLPDDLEKRFKYLFDKRKKWTQQELNAFIKDLCSNNTTEINNALTKYCRSFNQNNIKYFTSRM